MSTKALYWIGIFLGSSIGGYLPALFGQDLFSGWSIFGSAVGAFLGLYIAYRIDQGSFLN